MHSDDNPFTADLEHVSKELAATKAALFAEKRDRALIEEISTTIELTKLLDILGSEIERTGEFDGYLVNLVDEPHENLICEKIKLPPEYQGIEKTYLKYRFPANVHDANIECYKEKRPVYVDSSNVDHYPGSTQNRFERWRMESLVLIPIHDKDCPLRELPLGTVMAFKQDGEINREVVNGIEKRLLLFRKQIKNALFYNDLVEREKAIASASEEQQRFLKFITQVNNLTSTELIYETISIEFLKRFPFDLVGVVMREQDELVVKKNTIIDEKFKDLYLAWDEYYRQTRYKLDLSDGATSISFVQNTHLVINDALDILHLPMSAKDKIALDIMRTPRTFVFMPIRQQKQPIGLLWLISIEQPVQITDSQLQLIELLCSFIGTALANAELYALAADQKREIEGLNKSLEQKIDELRDLASKDRLTGLANFGFFEEELNRRVKEYHRDSAQKNLSMILLDVDHFKNFNDTYGHMAGNVVLQEVAKRLNSLTRKMDIACRYGGEEFAVVLPKCNIEGARLFAERIRFDMEHQPIVIEENGIKREITVTVSVGCSEYKQEEQASDFVERADKALYRAKESGRNRVEATVNEAN